MYMARAGILCLFQIAVIAIEDQFVFQSRQESADFFCKYDKGLYSKQVNLAEANFEEITSKSRVHYIDELDETQTGIPKATVKTRKGSRLFRISLYRTRHAPAPPPPCSYNPCINGACTNTGSSFNCACNEGWAGTQCDIDMCNPEEHGGADIAVLLDASSSQNQTGFDKQRDFIKSLITAFPIGVDEFRFSVTTYSSLSNVHFNLDTHLTNDSLLQAIEGIQYTNGTSNLHMAFSDVRNNVFGIINSTKTRYVLILGDGMVSNLRNAISETESLKDDGVTLVSVGFGSQIQHQGLIDAATSSSYVFPPTTEDLKNWLLRRHVMEECPDCSLYSSDVFLLLETSIDMDVTRYYQLLNAFKTLIARVPIYQDGVHVSLATFSDTVSEQFDFQTYFNPVDVIRYANSAFQETKSSNHTAALKYIRENAFDSSKGVRQGSRRVAVLFISEAIMDLSSVLDHADSLKSDNVTVVVITVSMETTLDISSLLQIVSDPAYLFVFGDSIYGDFSTSHVLLSLFQYEECIFD